MADDFDVFTCLRSRSEATDVTIAKAIEFKRISQSRIQQVEILRRIEEYIANLKIKHPSPTLSSRHSSIPVAADPNLPLTGQYEAPARHVRFSFTTSAQSVASSYDAQASTNGYKSPSDSLYRLTEESLVSDLCSLSAFPRPPTRRRVRRLNPKIARISHYEKTYTPTFTRHQLQTYSYRSETPPMPTRLPPLPPVNPGLEMPRPSYQRCRY